MIWQLNTYLLFVSWVDSILIILLYHLLHSWNHHFLSKWQEFEFFIFLIAWGIFFEWWELDLQLLPSSSSLLMSQASSSSRSQLKVITSFWHTCFAWMNPMILGDHSRWLSPLLHSPLLLLLLQDVLHSGSSHSSTVFLNPSSDLCSYLQIAW